MKVETSRISMTWDEGEAAKWTSLKQLPSGREFLDQENPQPVFRILRRKGKTRTAVLTAQHAAKSRVERIEGGCRVTWTGFKDLDLKVVATFKVIPEGGGIASTLEIENSTGIPVRSVSFPIVSCRLPLSGNGDNDAVLFPRHESVLLQRPHLYFAEENKWEDETYPGHVGFQFMAYFNETGGLYYGAHDGQGHTKNFRVRRGTGGFELIVAHQGMHTGGERWEQPYPVVIDGFEGDWMDAAEIYRKWSRQQSWCRKRITERDVPKWLQEGAAFYNYPAYPKNPQGKPLPFFPPDKVADAMADLHDEIGAPVVATPFSWEKHYVWIGPDYYPPKGGTDAYRKLTASLRERADRMMIFLSGFRWALGKPKTPYDGHKAFDERGRPMAVLDEAGEMIIQEPPWAKNVLLCVAQKGARELLADCFRKGFDLGVDIVQLDQNVGGDVEECWATDHGHPPGPGKWQGDAMRSFLDEVRREGQAEIPDRAVTVEEPCELFIQELDAYHGRAFTYEHWPVVGKGAVGIPVFLYLYHPYLPGYAGWTGGGFDLTGRVEASIGRAFIFGMHIGVRSNVWWNGRHEGDKMHSAFLMWRDAVQVQRRYSEALLLGDMARPPKMRGFKQFRPGDKGRAKTRYEKRVPLVVDAVQAATWLTDDGTVWYAVTNIDREAASVEIEIAPSSKAGSLQILKINASEEAILAKALKPGTWIPLDLEPFEVCCLRVTPGIAAPSGPAQGRKEITIPMLDISDRTDHQVIVERTPGQYLGHPTTVLMPDGKTIFATYPLGHGGPAAVLKKSTDGGLTWSDRLPVPENWATATNCPCIHRLVDPQGVARLFVFEGRTAMRQAVSVDDGETWTPFEPNGLNCVVAPITIEPVSGKRHLAVYQRNPREGKPPAYTIWQSVSGDGGLTWGPQRQVGEYKDAWACEPAVIRSPDGKQLACLMRENTRAFNSLLMVSNDEGETWSDMVELPASLTGDRHMPRYTDDGRLVITFRDMAKKSKTYGDFVAWVGRYENIVNLREGQYRVRLLNSPKKVDLGYAGLERLPDGTMVATTYAVLAEGEKHSVVSIRFTMDELDALAQEASRR